MDEEFPGSEEVLDEMTTTNNNNTRAMPEESATINLEINSESQELIIDHHHHHHQPQSITIYQTISMSPDVKYKDITENVHRQFEKRLGQTDVKIHTGIRFARAHRAVLAVASPFLAKIFNEVDPYQCKEICLSLPDIRYQDLMSLLEFIYRGQITVNKRRTRPLQNWLRVLGVHLAMDIIEISDSSSAQPEKSDGDVQKNQIITTTPVEENSTEFSSEDTLSKRKRGRPSKTQDFNVEMEKTTLEKGNDDDKEVVAVKKTVVIDKSKTGSKQLRFKCQHCDKHFQNETSLKTHNYIHTGEKPFTCDECGRSFRYKDSLVTHVREHTGERIACSVCSKEFKHMRDYKDHKNLHTGAKIFMCEICSLSFLTKKQMFNHKETHKLTPDPCPDCGKKLKNLASYRAHIKNHDSSRQFGCDTCGRLFKRNFDLKVHRRIHTGKKPHVCEICGKKFSLTSTLAKHRRFHTDIFPCSECSKTFSSTELVTQHLSSVHKGEEEQQEEQQNYILVNTVGDDGSGQVITSADIDQSAAMTIVGQLNESGRVSLSFENVRGETTIVMTEDL